MPSSSSLDLALGMVPGAPSSRTPATESFVSLGVTVPPQIVSLSEELRWTKTNPEHNAHCQSVLGALSADHVWSKIVRSLNMTLMASLITGRYGNTMRVVKLSPFRRQFLTQCFLEALSRLGISYEACKDINRKN